MRGVDRWPTERPAELLRLVEWGDRHRPPATGPSSTSSRRPRRGPRVSVSARECPGARALPRRATPASPSAARRAAADADVVVVNTHLYGMHLATGGAVLPEHDVVVFDEAHQLEDSRSRPPPASSSSRRPLHARSPARAESILATTELVGDLEASAGAAGRRARRAQRPPAARPLDEALAPRLALGRGRVDRAIAALRGDRRRRRRRRAPASCAPMKVADRADRRPRHVAGRARRRRWRGSRARRTHPRLKVAPIDVARPALEPLWRDVTAVLTSATIPPRRCPTRLGLPARRPRRARRRQPVRLRAPTRSLYCAAHLPDPRRRGLRGGDARRARGADRRRRRAARSRCSRRGGDARRGRRAPAARCPFADPRPGRRCRSPRCVGRVHRRRDACLFATMGFWQGVDVPGATLSLVTIDRLPFPRPDEPLLQARRERARADAFRARRPAAGGHAAGPGRRPADPLRAPTAASSPCSTRAWPRRRYRWDIVARCRRCAAPATAPRSRRSSASIR